MGSEGPVPIPRGKLQSVEKVELSEQEAKAKPAVSCAQLTMACVGRWCNAWRIRSGSSTVGGVTSWCAAGAAQAEPRQLAQGPVPLVETEVDRVGTNRVSLTDLKALLQASAWLGWCGLTS